MMRNFLLISMLLFMSSCWLFAEPMPKSWEWGARPRPLTGVRGFPETDTDYGKGFKNGCMLGWDSSSKGLKDLSVPELDPAMMAHNPDYNVGWWDGYEQCVYILDWDVL